MFLVPTDCHHSVCIVLGSAFAAWTYNAFFELDSPVDINLPIAFTCTSANNPSVTRVSPRLGTYHNTLPNIAP